MSASADSLGNVTAAPNWKASRADAALEHWSLGLAEMTFIAVYTSDVVMKMLYFGGNTTHTLCTPLANALMRRFV